MENSGNAIMSDQESMPIGYEPHGGGGISNQKIAFVGLLLEAFETKRSVVLPRFKIFDQITKEFKPLPFDSVFDPAPMIDFCRQHSMQVSFVHPEHLPGGYDDYFWKIHNVLHRIPEYPDDFNSIFVLDAFKALVPRVRSAFLTRILRDQFPQSDPDFVVVQFRIERDWQKHCEETLNALVPKEETNYLDFEAILDKISQSDLNAKNIFALCDEKAMPISKEEMKAIARDRHGISILLKSDFLSEFERKLLTELHLSLIDFEIATWAERFVGLTRSTFSCMATLERYARERKDVRQHYIYNLAGPKVMQRTDNGCYWDAHNAVASRTSATSV